MIGKGRILTLLRSVIAKSEADETEAVFTGYRSDTTRFAKSCIHQNMSEYDTVVTFRVALDGKIGIASTNSLAKDALGTALKNAIAIAKKSVRNRYFEGMPKPAKFKNVTTYFEPTAAYTAKQRAEVVRDIGRRAASHGIEIAGAFNTSSSELAVLNSNGVNCYQPMTFAWMNLIAMSDTSSGYAEGMSRNILKLPFAAIEETAVKKCLNGRNPGEIEPGKYDVILEPVAVASIIDWLALIGLGAKPFHEMTSFLSGKTGKKVMSPEISIFDDGNDKAGASMPFDFEGVPKKKVYFVKNGVAMGPVYDSLYAARYKVRSTGHALPAAWGSGPLPGNIFIKPGKKTKEALISSVKDGLLVTRFFYINGYLNTPKALMTGMTRDGTFRIKNGRIVGAVKNLRFTESISAAFSRVAGVSKETQLVKNWWGDIGCCSAPSIYIKKFNFSGKTEF